jgi:hypothetical protein
LPRARVALGFALCSWVLTLGCGPQAPSEAGGAEGTNQLEQSRPTAGRVCDDPEEPPPTPIGPTEGRGSEWRRLLGPSPNDFPGPAALIGPAPASPNSLGPDLQLGEPPPCEEHGVPAATVLPEGPKPVAARLDVALEAGAHLVLLEPTPNPLALTSLVLQQQRRTCETGELAHIGVSGALGASPPGAELVLFDAPPSGQLPALHLASRLLRGRGARAFVRSGSEGPFVGLPGQPAALATHLVLGSGIWVDAEVHSPPPLLAFARAHRDLFGLPTASVALLSVPGKEELLLAAAGHLEAAHIQFEVIERDRRTGPESRSDAFLLVVQPSEFPEPGLAGRVLRALENDADARPGSLAPQVRTDLPPEVLIERRRLPHRNALAHHLVRRAPRGSAPLVGATLHVRPWVTGPMGACKATWLAPESPNGTPIECAIDEEGSAALDLPALRTWGIVLTEPDLPSVLPPPSTGAIRMRPEEPMPNSVSVQLDVPAWAAGVEEITLFVPERLEANGHPLRLTGPPTFEVSEDATRIVATAAGPKASLRVELTGSEGVLDVSLRVTNQTPEPLEEVRALVCLESQPAGAFPREGHDRTWTPGPSGPVSLGSLPEDQGNPRFRDLEPPWYPLTMLESIDRRWVMAQVFEQSDVVGGNAGRTYLCIHSRPSFGAIAPGATVSRRGRLYLTRDTAEGIQARYQASPLEALPAPPRPDPYRVPCR